MVLGLGYVGLPLAVALARKFDVVGFDIDARRVEGLKSGHDVTCEVTDEELASSARATGIQARKRPGPGFDFQGKFAGHQE